MSLKCYVTALSLQMAQIQLLRDVKDKAMIVLHFQNETITLQGLRGDSLYHTSNLNIFQVFLLPK